MSSFKQRLRPGEHFDMGQRSRIQGRNPSPQEDRYIPIRAAAGLAAGARTIEHDFCHPPGQCLLGAALELAGGREIIFHERLISLKARVLAYSEPCRLSRI